MKFSPGQRVRVHPGSSWFPQYRHGTVTRVTDRVHVSLDYRSGEVRFKPPSLLTL